MIPPFKQGPEDFDTIRMKTAIHVLACLMVYHNVFELVIFTKGGAIDILGQTQKAEKDGRLMTFPIFIQLWIGKAWHGLIR